MKTVDYSQNGNQLLKFTEPLTGVPVILIGAMHYNPASIALTRSVLQDLGDQKRLGSVIIESCDIRWNKTASMNSQSPFMNDLLQNEMQAAREEATKFNVPVILGDQLINITTARIKESFRATVFDILSPLFGWNRIVSDISNAFEQSFYPPRDVSFPLSSSQSIPVNTAVTSSTNLKTSPTSISSKEYLGVSDFLEPSLLAALPVSLVRYPLAIALKAPVAFFGLTLALGAASSYADILSVFTNEGTETTNLIAATSSSTSSSLVLLQDILSSSLSILLEFAVLGRVFLVTILAERNVVLADSIRLQCEQVKKNQNGNNKPVVVAVLGMAHCNGIKRLMTTASTSE
eukprot:CAMPEP_0170059004 /NCGR_PEP_ID=MMETSP0019_2-20121128/1427_1 /TAXON_ID=98059 /ORGANISM="Dinobryon sp., Strain UTEXLB2267" /LENGTH=346 /DNA_ID=CAMNT_0010264111 /DNA_START=126 /DNA_END=1166 /DNA_ORIENTATION=-